MTLHLLTPEDLTPELNQQMANLFRQLTDRKEALPVSEVLDEADQLSLVYCKEGNHILGMAALASYSVLSGHKGWIEDVVVDANARGRGIGRLLVEKLLDIARLKGLTDVLLFTANHRESAIHLYKKLGFVASASGMYYLNLENT
ncbi:GNAT family N-acetyltransferase [Flagellimonas flava]|uniref:Phosphinothricin acetyltransferase n=1 Tax=Flagellimonas flava TaxID=570519 RepID=A0A1M5KK54_9FLAO|nr:GNAT family N-acetyltransferase [Allomuricauda flava]SHG53118.1 phosphinothricin acetyltransferase [Allomuricauda flava]